MTSRIISIFLIVLPAITIAIQNRVPRAKRIPLSGLTCIPAASCKMGPDAFGVARAPRAGNIYSLTLTWRFGSVKFYERKWKEYHEGIFGPKTQFLNNKPSRKVGIFVTRDDYKQVLFPRRGTQGYTGSGVKEFYYVESYQPNATSLTFILPDGLVSDREILRFYFGHVLYETEALSTGSVCVTLTWQFRMDRKLYPVAGVTCLPVGGDIRDAYGAALLPNGADRLENLTLTYSFGHAEFCRSKCKVGTFGYDNMIPVYVYREDGTLMFPVAGRTIGYHPDPNVKNTYGGYYTMDGNTGTGNSITFRLPRQEKPFAPGELIKFVFGDKRYGGWKCLNGGTVCVSVTGMLAAQPTPTGFSCPDARGFQYACTCRQGKCQTFDRYVYEYAKDNRDISVYLVKPAPPLYLLPFSVSATLSSRAGSASVRVALREDSMFKEYVEILMDVYSASFRRASDPQGQMTPIVDGETNRFTNGKYVYSKIGNRVSQLLVFFGSWTDVENVLIQVNPEGSVSVVMTDCYKNHVYGMCGGFQGDLRNDEKLMLTLVGRNGDFSRLKDGNLVRMRLSQGSRTNSRRPRSRVMNDAFEDIEKERGVDKAVPIWIGVGIFVGVLTLCGACVYGIRRAKRGDWDPIAE